MKLKFRLLWCCLSSALLCACSDEPKLSADFLIGVLNPVLQQQDVIIKAPGFPSKEVAMALVLEDPSLPENQSKPYHPAEKLGWEQMLEYARAFEKSGALKLETGTFSERDYFDQPFSFSGHRLHVVEPLKSDTVILPALGKVGFKLGKSCVAKVLKVTDPVKHSGRYEFEVTFETGLCQLKSWANGELVTLSGVGEHLNEPQTVKLSCLKQQCEILDSSWLETLLKPKLAF